MRARRPLAATAAVGLMALIVLAGVAYAGLCLWFAANQRAFVFLPVERPSASPSSQNLAGVAEVTIRTEDGERIYGWWSPPKPGHGALVLLIAKGLVLSDAAGLYGDLVAQGFGVLGIDYRGNGASTGAPSEAGLRADGRAAFDFVRAACPRTKIAVIGESLGTGIAVGLAVDRPVAGLLLNSAYASVVRLFELRGWPLPYRLLMTDPLDTERLIGRVGAPVMLLHGTADAAVPIAEARRLFAAAREPKMMIEVGGASHSELWFGEARERALAALAAWTAP